MADSKGNTEVQHLDLLVSALITLIAGLVIHLFIIGVNANDWWKGRSVTAVDHIVTSLGISRICTQFTNILYLFVIFVSNLDSPITRVTMEVVYACFTATNVWLTSLLSIVFCLKISNLQTRLFQYLRRIIVQRTAYTIIASMLLSICNCLMPMSIIITEVTKSGTYNTTVSLFLNCFNSDYAYNYFIGASIPVLFYYISSILLFVSLYYHTARMKRSSNLTINLETYYSVMKFVSFTFIYNTIYFSAIFACIFYHYVLCVNFPWTYIILGFLPVLHSSYLIFRTSKLKSHLPKVLQNVINFLFQKHTETRKNMKNTVVADN